MKQVARNLLVTVVFLAGCSSSGYKIEPGAHLNNADLSGADLNNADLRGAHLSFANLSGAERYRVDLHGAVFLGTTMPDGTVLSLP